MGRRGLHGVLRIGVRHFREQLLRRLDHLGRLGLCAVGQKMLHGLQHALDGVWLEHHSGVSQRQRQTRERRGCVDLQLRLGRRHDHSGRLRRAAVEQMERRGAGHQRVEESAAVARDQRQAVGAQLAAGAEALVAGQVDGDGGEEEAESRAGRIVGGSGICDRFIGLESGEERAFGDGVKQAEDEGETRRAVEGREAEADVRRMVGAGGGERRVVREGEDDLRSVAAAGAHNHLLHGVVLHQLAGGGGDAEKEPRWARGDGDGGVGEKQTADGRVVVLWVSRTVRRYGEKGKAQLLRSHVEAQCWLLQVCDGCGLYRLCRLCGLCGG